MKPTRSLTLRSETLSALTTEELASVAGAADHTTPLVACVSQALSCAIYVPSNPTCLVLDVYSRLAC
jgi:hypothetical protein